jgi:hypothetical protein
MGIHICHASEVPPLLNISTGRIMTQFHVVFDDKFTTVASIGRETDPPSHWEELILTSSVKITADDPPSHLIDD